MVRNKFLLFSSVVLGLASQVRFFLGFLFMNTYASVSLYKPKDPVTRAALLVDLLLVLCWFFELAGAIAAGIHSREPAHRNRLWFWGLASLVTGLAGNIGQVCVGYGASVYAWITGLFAPVLFLFGIASFRKTK